ncbi:ASG_G0028990.mRNA.1.CDS.1 [Saccharomyces cerevisiae]|uniref:Structural maintenance of chromosomes protein n=1 Tax=Saccharomyces cerevisiae (strain Lalvin EC1118 / Prise de mousse) TaxID=643680 RepID=C8ZBE0_YEAS8|nr:Smc3p [Saccharomyces cerevisiae YJM993]AJP39632.1 Smc3p [Saccharomyces cerevisiae YJM1078]AJR55526.1 Smc3p [Saccharomyces cerevisiae YJM969]AJR55854.1 Smc3p [Saccharomyces cerevisiae YJM972]AJR57163.1 Smc3p [Saccharomyces cerevisiae YJM984]AJR57820.1 Smc3p [Saccharomyces cerevisiae YJM990]AJR58148.1 Smc3p [Saccharomyces cerevisiae YJM996]AJR60768.1 Smc3p [Saccharomyces cerevisiae YJM248]AJR66887.1 Smc3p [Saccharomyces cerevisiae YJM1242]AJR68167.1 Smc3p [Saccharomyces cerevisiae YJM1252
MYIKRVIIKGFKTYRNETIIDNFSPHQNVIIGSNGSGKSNFFAAIRFVLSDDYSNLKREERQGLIHQGSGGSVMSASVEIVFHDPDHSMILPSGVLSRGDDEVTIRRTVGLKKDDYQLNDRNVTKGDIVRMLETAGFSMNNPYNIVPQGKIVALTNAKDKERLQLLEDVVGAKSFEVKLKASLKKMEETEQKKIQINKEMGELNSKLSEMEQERKELEKYNELERNRKIYQFTLYDRELNEVINQMERLDGDYNNTVYSSEQYIQELDKREDMIDQVSKKLSSIEASLKIKNATDLQQAKLRESEISQKLTNVNVKIKDVQQQIESNGEQRNLDSATLKEIKSIIEQRKQKLSKILPRYQELTKEEAMYKLQLASLQQKQRDLILKKGEYARFKSKDERDTWIHSEIEELKSSIQNLNELESQLQMDRTSLRKQYSAIDEEIEELIDSINGPDTKGQLEDFDSELIHLKKKLSESLDTRKELWRKEQKLQTVLETLLSDVNQNQRNVNETMSRSLANGIINVKEITEKLKISPESVFGTLGELIKVNDKYKTCAEVIGGNSLFHIVVDTEETATLIMNELYRMKGGRVTFIPLNRLSLDSDVKFPSNTTTQIQFTPLIKKIKYEPRFEKAVKHVFGKTIVVKDLGQGLKLAKKHKLNAITLDGDRADKRGVLTGGYLDQHKRTRLESLKNLNESRSQHKKILEELDFVRNELNDIDTKIDQVNGNIRKVSNDRESVLTNIEIYRTSLNTKKNEKLILEESLNAIILKLEKLNTNRTFAQEKLNTFENDLLQEFDSELSKEEKERLESLTKEISAAHNKLNITSDALEGITTTIDSLNAELESKLIPQENDLESKMSEVGDAFIFGLQDELKELQLEKESVEKQHENAVLELGTVQREIESLIAEETNNKKLLEKANNQQRLLLKKLDNFQKSVEKTMIKKTTLVTRREELQQRIREIGLLPEDALVNDFSDITSDQLLQRLNDMNTEISGLKNVNKRAFENFKKFNERRKDLAERASELDESKDSIQDLIVKLKQQKVNAVDSTFQKVSENFEAVFERLVPRGTAKLIIHRKNDNANDHDESIDVDMDAESNESQNGKDSEIMYTGVSISVSFNSKQNEQLHVEQLSGGQKTVCAIALILAIQMVDPASFYLFDEIDAALDKQYRTAVATLLKELSKNAQFICTTFRTDMLQVADKFFRVKYENKISTVIEVNREEAIGFIRGSNKFAEV